MALRVRRYELLDGPRNRNHDFKFIDRHRIRARRVLQPVAEQIQLLARKLSFQHVEQMHQWIVRKYALARAGKRHRAFVLLLLKVSDGCSNLP